MPRGINRRCEKLIACCILWYLGDEKSFLSLRDFHSDGPHLVATPSSVSCARIPQGDARVCERLEITSKYQDIIWLLYSWEIKYHHAGVFVREKTIRDKYMRIFYLSYKYTTFILLLLLSCVEIANLCAPVASLIQIYISTIEIIKFNGCTFTFARYHRRRNIINPTSVIHRVFFKLLESLLAIETSTSITVVGDRLLSRSRGCSLK